MELLTWLGNTGAATWVRESESLLGYTLYLAFHTIGMVFLVGPNLVIAARVLGLAPGLPVRPMAAFRPFITLGMWLTIITGFVLFATAPVGYVKNGVFVFKIVVLIASLICIRKLLRELFTEGIDADAVADSPRIKRLTLISVLLWAAGIVAGRLTAYSGVVVFASLVAFGILLAIVTVIALIARLLSNRGERQTAFAMNVHPSPVKGGK